MRLRTPSPATRHGLSLLEVLVAMAILLFAMAAIGRLVTIGTDQALEVQWRGEAARKCQSQMARVVAGEIPMQSAGDTAFDEDADWNWSVEVEQGTVQGLWNVTVKVTRVKEEARKVQVTLQRLVMDPSLRGNTADAAAPAGTDSTSSGSTTGSSSTTTGGTTTTPGTSK